MLILGIDPSLASTGWALLNKNNQNYKYISSGVCKTSPKDDTIIRLDFIRCSIKTLLNDVKPNVVVIEENYVSINPGGSIKLALARGIILGEVFSYFKDNDLDLQSHVKQVSPAFVKKTVTGSGNADKEQIDKMVKLILPELKDTKLIKNDQSDAIAIALSFV
jgi:crossover junction endodeoxyribonuclease RuvC